MRRLTLLAVVAAICAVAFTSCKKEADLPTAEIAITAVDPEISPAALEQPIYVPMTVSTFSMTVKSTLDWTAVGSEKWVKMLPSSGVAGIVTPVNVYIGANTGDDSRECTLAVVSGSSKKELKFIQYGKKTTPTEVKVSGLDEQTVLPLSNPDTLVFSVESNAPWTLTSPEWLSCNPVSGNANEKVSVTMLVAENFGDQRTDTVKITSGTAVRKFSVTQSEYSGPALDTHAPGTVFYGENFNWIGDSWVAKYPKYGLPSVKLDGATWNEYAIIKEQAAIDAFSAKGYSSEDYNDYSYVRYEGFMKLGSSSQLGKFVTLAPDGKNGTVAVDDGTIAKLLVSFDAMLYLGTDGVLDPAIPTDIDIAIQGEGTISACGTVGATIAADKKSASIPLTVDENNKWAFVTKTILVAGADKNTRIVFGGDKGVGTRPMVDNIILVRAENGATAAAADTFAAVPQKESVVEGLATEAECSDGIATVSVRINRAWTATSDAAWAKISKVTAGTSTTNIATVSSDRLSASEPGMWLPGTITVSCENNPQKETRSANITVTDSEGNSTVVAISQKPNDGKKEIAKWTFTSVYKETYVHTDGKSYEPDPNAKQNALAWLGTTHEVPDNYHSGAASFSVVNVSRSTFEYSTATSSQVWNRLRVKGFTKDDYFQFKVKSLTAKASDKIALKYAYLCAANGNNTPTSWKEQYSYDGTTWTDIKSIGKIENDPSKWTDLSCEITIDRAMNAAPFYIRVVALTAAGTPSNSIPYIAVDPAMAAAATSYATRTKYYTDAKDFITIVLTEVEE